MQFQPKMLVEGLWTFEVFDIHAHIERNACAILGHANLGHAVIGEYAYNLLSIRSSDCSELPA